MAAVKIKRYELDASQLRAAAGRTADAKQARRILALAMVLDGHPRSLAAKSAGMDRQTLRDWVQRYNAEGLAGLADHPRPGRPPRLNAEQMQELNEWVEAGADPKQDGVVRWPCKDLRDRIKTRFSGGFHEHSVGKLLDKLDFSNITDRPVHP